MDVTKKDATTTKDTTKACMESDLYGTGNSSEEETEEEDYDDKAEEQEKSVIDKKDQNNDSVNIREEKENYKNMDVDDASNDDSTKIECSGHAQNRPGTLKRCNAMYTPVDVTNETKQVR